MRLFISTGLIGLGLLLPAALTGFEANRGAPLNLANANDSPKSSDTSDSGRDSFPDQRQGGSTHYG